MANNYQFLDAYGSVLTASSSVVAGAHQPLVQIASVLSPFPIIQTGVVITSISGAITVGSLLGVVNANVGSIIGTYAEDSVSASGDNGLFTLSIRNDSISSFVSANGDYAPNAVDSSGRRLTKPFAPTQSEVRGLGSVVGVASVFLVAAAGAGLKNYITDVTVINTGATASRVDFTDGDGSILGRTIAPAGGGSNIIGMQIPMVTSVNQPFNLSAATASSVISAYAYGYKAP